MARIVEVFGFILNLVIFPRKWLIAIQNYMYLVEIYALRMS